MSFAKCKKCSTFAEKLVVQVFAKHDVGNQRRSAYAEQEDEESEAEVISSPIRPPRQVYRPNNRSYNQQVQ